jgi:hypothetical protein
MKMDGMKRFKKKNENEANAKAKKTKLKIFSILRQSEENSLLENDNTVVFFPQGFKCLFHNYMK